MTKSDLHQNLFNRLTKTGQFSREGQLTIKVTKVGCEEIVNEVFNDMRKAIVAGEKVNIPQIGMFKTKQANSRIARNPKTGEKVTVPAHKKISFNASKGLKEQVR